MHGTDGSEYCFCGSGAGSGGVLVLAGGGAFLVASSSPSSERTSPVAKATRLPRRVTRPSPRSVPAVDDRISSNANGMG